MTKNLRKEIYRRQDEIRNLFPEKPSIKDGIFQEIGYTKELVEALEKINLKREKVEKLLQKIKNTRITILNRTTKCRRRRCKRQEI
ncbi:MAG: hypothetical protein ACK5JH_16805 [Anaerocolumna sp.]